MILTVLLRAGRLLIAAASLHCMLCVGDDDACSSVYSLPPEYLGYTYEVLMWPPGSGHSDEALFSVVSSTSASTRVRVRLAPGPFDCVIMFGASVRLYCGQTVDFTLVGVENATFTSTTTDLSGTLVEASMPVAVYVSNLNVAIGPSNITDSTREQLFPVSAWGREFVVTPVPDNNRSGYSIRMSCARAEHVSVTVSGQIYQITRQRPLTVDFSDNRPAYVSVVNGSDIQLVQFVRGATTSTDGGAPAALVLPAVDRYSVEYSVTSIAGYVHYVSVATHRSDVSGLRLNGQPLNLPQSAWLIVDGPSDWVTTSVLLPAASTSTLSHTGPRPFAAYSYAYISRRCAIANPAGASLPVQVLHSLV